LDGARKAPLAPDAEVAPRPAEVFAGILDPFAVNRLNLVKSCSRIKLI
jgi:hypothetical protein